MPTVKGRSEVKAFLDRLPAQLEAKVLRGAARAAIGVVKDEVSTNLDSHVVREALHVPPTKVEPGRISVKLTVKGAWPRSLATWQEYGTAPHIISVADDRDRQGMSIARINQVQKGGTLVIGGRPIGKVVEHPGVDPHPVFRPALDSKEREAIAAAQSYISSRVRPGGIVDNGGPLMDEDE